MRALKVLFVVFFVAAVASTAMATTVQLSGAVSGSYTLNSINISNDTITISVNGGVGSCTPTSASISPLTMTVNVTQGSSAPAQSVYITDNCGTNLTYTATVTAGSFISVPTGGTGPMSVTLNTASLAAGSYSGTISVSVTPGTYPAQTINVSLNVLPPGGGGGGGGTRILAGQQVKDTISPLGEKDYYFTSGASVSKTTVYMSTQDWSTNQDMYVSTSAQPKCSGTQVSPVWSNVNPDNNETVWIYIPFPANTTFYVTVCNRSAVGGSYKLYWSAF